MKKTIKIFSITLIIVFFALTFTACGLFGNGGDPSNPTGDPSDPPTPTEILIDTVQGLKDISTAATTGGGKIYKLTTDLDLGGIEWEPISVFYETLDGNGHTLSNFKLNKSGSEVNLGFFAVNGGIIKNLNFENILSMPSAANYVGVVAGVNYKTIQNCTVKNFSFSTKGSYVGGIAGRNHTNGNTYQNALIDDCSVESTIINGTGIAFGGIIGDNSGGAGVKNSTSVLNDIFVSYSGGNKSASGGLVAGWSSANITDCHITGGKVVSSVSGSGTISRAGGIVGYNRAAISLCSVGNMLTDQEIKQVEIEATETGQYAYAGGIAGENYSNNSTINNCVVGNEFGVVKISALAAGNGKSNFVGGITGDNRQGAMISQCITRISAFSRSAGLENGYAGGITGMGGASISKVYAVLILQYDHLPTWYGGIIASNDTTVSNAYYELTTNGSLAPETPSGVRGSGTRHDRFIEYFNQDWLATNLNLDFNNIWEMHDVEFGHGFDDFPDIYVTYQAPALK